MHDLGWLRRVAVRGEDRFRWLSGMVTNTVNDLGDERRRMEPGAQRAGAHPGRPARLARGRELELEIAADQYDRLLAHLERFIIMDDVELAACEARLRACPERSRRGLCLDGQSPPGQLALSLSKGQLLASQITQFRAKNLCFEAEV